MISILLTILGLCFIALIIIGPEDESDVKVHKLMEDLIPFRKRGE